MTTSGNVNYPYRKIVTWLQQCRDSNFNVILLMALLLLIGSSSAQADWLRAEQAIMGTRVTVELSHPDPSRAQQAVNAVMQEMHRIDRSMSPFRPDSELSLVNARAAEGPVSVSRELIELIKRAEAISHATEGAFDITFASAGHLYDYRKQIHPKPEQLKNAVTKIDYRHLIIDTKAQTIQFTRVGVKIDLGGIAKGHAVDRSIDILRHMGVTQAIVSAGGDSRILGTRAGRPWMIGVRDPRDAQAVVAVVPLTDKAISTSGDYERFFEADGTRYHHIIDPSTGASASAVRSVTVIGPDSTTTDALSTSVFVLGFERGLSLIDATPEVDAVIVGGTGRLYFSHGLVQAQQQVSSLPAHGISPEVLSK